MTESTDQPQKDKGHYALREVRELESRLGEVRDEHNQELSRVRQAQTRTESKVDNLTEKIDVALKAIERISSRGQFSVGVVVATILCSIGVVEFLGKSADEEREHNATAIIGNLNSIRAMELNRYSSDHARQDKKSLQEEFRRRDDRMDLHQTQVVDEHRRIMELAQEGDKAIVAPLIAEIDNLKAEAKLHAEWRAEHDREVSDINATQTQRIKDLEAEVVELRRHERATALELSRRSSTIEAVKAEQEKRRPIVYPKD